MISKLIIRIIFIIIVAAMIFYLFLYRYNRAQVGRLSINTVVCRLQSAIKHFEDNCKRWIDDRIGQDELTLTARVFKKDDIYSVLARRLRRAYRTRDVWNIAIIGGKGVGKTSFVKTYEARHTLPFCKYLYISIGDCIATEGTTDLSEDYVEAHILKQIFARARHGDLPEAAFQTVPERKRKPILFIETLVLTIGIWILILTFDQWNTIVASEYRNSVKAVLYIITIVWSCIAASIILIKKWNQYEIKKIKFSQNNVDAEIERKNKLSLDAYLYEVIYALKSMRWKIGHTVVIEDMELLGDDECLKLFGKLKMLNKSLNNNLLSFHFLNMTGIFRPIRFLYLYRDNISERIKSDKFFQETIPVPNRIERHNITDIINGLLQNEAKKRKYSTEFVDRLTIDTQYLYNIAEYLTNYRAVYSVIKDFFSLWDTFTQKIEYKNISIDDAKRLFSFTVYGYIFSDDRKKFCSKECLALNIREKSCLDTCVSYNMSQKELFWYLVKECPETYRINYLCKRFDHIDFNKADQYIVQMKNAISAGNYDWALQCIELALCCEPEKAEYYRWRIEILKSLNRDDEISFDVSQEIRFKA